MGCLAISDGRSRGRLHLVLADALLEDRPKLPKRAANAPCDVSCWRPFPMAWEDLTLGQELCLDLGQKLVTTAHLPSSVP